MWEYEHSAETTAAPGEVWRLWSDMQSWPVWNDGIEKIEIDGPFAVGTTFTMTPPGDDPVRMRRTEISGPAAGQVGPEIGPVITADFPDVVAALAKLAEG